MPNAYDRIRYPGQPYGQAHPALLGAFAHLFGLPYAPFEGCRVLEIGCGDGVNLIALALAAPQARFVGVDLAEGPIAQARADALACGCANVDFFAADLRDIGPEFGAFDYIVAHGVLAWVPEPVRAALLPVIGARLAPHGLAMVSFNALPGARAWQAMRDMLQIETKGAGTPEEALARARAFLERNLPLWSKRQADGVWMAGVARRILDRAPEVLFHDELGAFYAPQLLSDVAAAAAAAGLGYLGDSRPNINEEAWFPSEAAAEARARAAGDWTAFQQQLDFLELRSFHNAIFARGLADRRRDASRLKGLYARADIREGEPNAAGERVFAVGPARLTTNDPQLASLFETLGAAYPADSPLDAVRDLEKLESQIYRMFASGVLTLSTAPGPARRTPGERPFASPLARLQAARGERNLATLTHAVLRIDDAPLQALLLLLDGTRDRATLAFDWAAAAGLDAGDAREALEGALATLAQAGVLGGAGS